MKTFFENRLFLIFKAIEIALRGLRVMGFRSLMINIFLFIFFSLICFHQYGFTAEIPYQNCIWSDEAYTRDLTSYYRRNWNPEDLLTANFQDEVNSDITESCFYFPMMSSAHICPRRHNYYFCTNDGNGNLSLRENMEVLNPPHAPQTSVNLIFPRRPCLNEAYVKMTAKSFNDTASCFDLNKRKLFLLINHESYFIINIKSRSGARCYGQLVRDNIISTMVNRRCGNSRQKNIYRSVLTNCPNLEEKLISEGENQIGCYRRGVVNRFKERYSDQITCPIVHDPYTCLFYTMYSVRFILDQVRKKLDHNNNRRDFSEKQKKDFKLPLKFDQVLTLKGEVVDKQNVRKSVSWVIIHESELFSILSKVISYEGVEIEKINLISPKEDFIWDLVYWSHNGGFGGVNNVFRPYLRSLKEGIGNRCSSNEASERCLLRRRILSGSSIPIENFREKFRRHLRRYYLSDNKGRENDRFQDRRNEVGNFVSHVYRNFESCFNVRTVGGKLKRLFCKRSKEECESRGSGRGCQSYSEIVTEENLNFLKDKMNFCKRDIQGE